MSSAHRVAQQGSHVVPVEIDPEGLFPDVGRDNNVWDSSAAADDEDGAGGQDNP